jgi:tight adherence protein B
VTNRVFRGLAAVVALVAVAAPAATAASKPKPSTAKPQAQTPPFQVTPVGRLPFPERGYVIDLPAGAAIGKHNVQVSENNLGMGDFTFEALASSGVSYGTVLAVDASDSMKGRPEAGAIAAAKAFVAHRASSQEISVVAFNSAIDVLQQPTIDPGQLQTALAHTPPLAYGTHIFDAINRSLRLLAAHKISAGTIVLLSDGADIGSRTTLAGVVSTARKQHVRIFTVGLRSGAFDARTLAALAAGTGGTFAVASSTADLSRIYSQLGSRLSREYLLTYRSLAAPSSTVDVSITLGGIGTSTSRYVAPTPSELPPYHRPFLRRFLLSGWSLLLLALVVAALAAGAIRLALDAARSRFVERIRAFAGSEGAPGAAPKRQDEWRTRATRARASGSAAARGWLGRLDEQLDIGGIRASSRWVVLVTMAATLAAVVILGTVAPVFAVLGLGTPLITRAWIKRSVRKVRDEFAEQLPPNLQVLVSGLRAGYTLPGAMTSMVEHASEPSRRELGRAITDEQLGVPLEEAIRRVATRMASRDLEQLAILAELVRTTGGNAAEVLDAIVFTIRERQDIRRLVRTLTTQGRLARWILTGLPIATGLAFWAIQPRIVGSTWKTTSGEVLLVIAAAMITAGSLIIQRIIEIEV